VRRKPHEPDHWQGNMALDSGNGTALDRTAGYAGSPNPISTATILAPALFGNASNRMSGIRRERKGPTLKTTILCAAVHLLLIAATCANIISAHISAALSMLPVAAVAVTWMLAFRLDVIPIGTRQAIKRAVVPTREIFKGPWKWTASLPFDRDGPPEEILRAKREVVQFFLAIPVCGVGMFAQFMLAAP